MPNRRSLSLDPVVTAREVGKFWRTELPRAIQAGHDVGAILDYGVAWLAATTLRGTDNQEPSYLMWQQAGEILQPGWLQMRAREKPRGYAGDHEMLGAIYQLRVTADPLGSAYDEYFLRQTAPQAVRNRMFLVRDRLVELFQSKRTPKVVVVGSGSALDVVDALQSLPEQAKRLGEIWLLDLDPAAIAAAELNLLPHLGGIRLVAQSVNLARLPRMRGKVEDLAGADLVICTGFFDYLEEAAAVQLLRMMWQCLQTGGQALIFNFAPWNPTRAYMEWIGNWYLLYRSRAELACLASAAGVDAQNCSISADATGIDLLLTLQKPN